MLDVKQRTKINTEASMTIRTNEIQSAIGKLDGEIGVNIANITLNELVAAFESGMRLPLNTHDNVSTFLSDLDTVIAELLTFRNQMVTAVNQNAKHIEEPLSRGEDTPEWKSIQEIALRKLNNRDNHPHLNHSEAMNDVAQDESLFLYECEVGIFDDDDDLSTAQDTKQVLVASDNVENAKSDALDIAINYLFGAERDALPLIELMAEPSVANPISFY